MLDSFTVDVGFPEASPCSDAGMAFSPEVNPSFLI